jgi:hypothetical protein
VDCGNGTVTDTATGLVWLKNADCFGEMDYMNANNAAAGLEHGECGLTDNSSPGDWRLPTRAEWEATVARSVELGCMLPSLTDTAGTGCYAAGTQPFTGVALEWYWSSSTATADFAPMHASSMVMDIGAVNNISKADSMLMFVWPVR